MKILCTIILFGLLSFSKGHSQNENTLINKFDSIGRKQGLWIYNKHSRLESRGYYLNDKKTGKWLYYDTESDHYYLAREIEYYKNGSVKIILGMAKIQINPDSSLVTLYKPKHPFVKCRKIRNGGYSCARYNKRNQVISKKDFEDFFECFLHLETKW